MSSKVDQFQAIVDSLNYNQTMTLDRAANQLGVQPDSVLFEKLIDRFVTCDAIKLASGRRSFKRNIFHHSEIKSLLNSLVDAEVSVVVLNGQQYLKLTKDLTSIKIVLPQAQAISLSDQISRNYISSFGENLLLRDGLE